MTTIADSRKLVLDRIREAARESAPAADLATEVNQGLAREYVRRGTMEAHARIELMAERLREYDAEVVECAPAGIAAAIDAQLTASGRRTIVAPVGLPAGWRAAGFEWKIDNGLPVEEIEGADGVVTECFCGVAESGTIVLHHSAAEGRRAITLLPDWHLCVLRASQIVETLPEYFDRCAIGDQVSGVRGQGEETHTALVTWISGPSATADIEMTRIKGVHGPRFLHVVLVKDEGPGTRD